MIRDLFEEDVRDVQLAPGATLLGGFALWFEAPCLTALQRVVEAAPFRHMVTPGGHRMSVAMTNCGAVGWVTDQTGYRYDSHDPQTGRRWPAMPDVFADLADQAAAQAGFGGFAPDACLINRYEPGARLSLHQDKNERDSVSLVRIRPQKIPLLRRRTFRWSRSAKCWTKTISLRSISESRSSRPLVCTKRSPIIYEG